MKIVERRFGPRNIVVCTSVPLDSEAASGKLKWIQREIPEYSRRYLLGPAKEFCAPGLMIDDSDFNVDNFELAGGKAVLVPRPWNSLHFTNTLETLQKAIS